MNIRKMGIPSILPDNDMQYISYLVRIVEKVDNQASITIIGRDRGYRFLVKSSREEELLIEIKEMNYLLGVRATYYKSPSAQIDFVI